jgi:aspartate aminotransferase
MQDTAPTLSSLQARLPNNPVRAIFARAAADPETIRLEVGQPDFPTPAHICEAAQRAIADGWHGYTPMGGLPSLRARIVAKLKRVNGIEVGIDQVVLGNGGTGVLSGAVTVLADSGDEVLVPDPHWGGYNGVVGLSGARVVRYPCPAESGYLPDVDAVASLVTPRTRVLLLNSPHNPTGAVYPAETMTALGELAARHGLWIVSDECYDQIVLDGDPVAPSMLHHADPERVVAVFTFSKTYAMTGWRVGYGVGPAPVIGVMTKSIDGMGSCINTLGQKAAEAALDGPQECVGEMVDAYRRRRDLAVDLLREAGMLVSVPAGAFYAMADISAGGLDSVTLATRLLDERKVSVAPGIAFGPGGEDAVRISLASSDQDLREGIGRLADLVSELAARR